MKKRGKEKRRMQESGKKDKKVDSDGKVSIEEDDE
jgi:hypothetical protein